jgi:hypothetical protein
MIVITTQTQQELTAPTQQSPGNARGLSNKSDFYRKNLELLARFSQSALHLLRIPFYRHIQAAKQYLNVTSAQQRYKKLFINSSQNPSAELSFNKVNAISSLILAPITMSYYALQLYPEESPSFLRENIQKIAGCALTYLTILALIKTCFSIKNLMNEMRTSCIHTQQSQDAVSWKHNGFLVLCEGAKLSLNFTRLIAPKNVKETIKLFYNLNTLIHCPLQALKLWKKQQYEACPHSQQHTPMTC